MNNIEIWKEINFANNYEVSNYGRIKNKLTNEILKGSFVGRKKYKAHGLMINGKRVFKPTHRIVALHFIENPNNYPIINHIDENHLNNYASNLEWTTNQLNIRHSNKKKIKQLSLNNELIKIWDALHLIGDAGYKIPRISEVLNKKQYRKTACGYKWEYVSENDGNQEDTQS